MSALERLGCNLMAGISTGNFLPWRAIHRTFYAI